mmetsp:Transcript_12499/g.23571  ORF Transcript_12499/g.23571 Transcript_12499/m.23571 type:complete len:325 (+) Transcript_12499:331-1305(+)
MILKRRQPLRPHRPIHHAMIATQRRRHHDALFINFPVLPTAIVRNDPIFNRPQRQRTRLRLPHDGSAAFDPEHTQIDHREGSDVSESLGPFRGGIFLLHDGRHPRKLLRDGHQPLPPHVFDDRRIQTRSVPHHDVDVDGIVHPYEGVVHPRGVGGGYRFHGRGGGFEEEVVDGDSSALEFQGGVEIGTEREEVVEGQVDGEVIVGDVSFGGVEAGGEFDGVGGKDVVDVAGAADGLRGRGGSGGGRGGRGGGGGRRRGGGGGGRRNGVGSGDDGGGGIVLRDVLGDDPSPGSGADDSKGGDVSVSHLFGQGVRSGRGDDAFSGG